MNTVDKYYVDGAIISSIDNGRYEIFAYSARGKSIIEWLRENFSTDRVMLESITIKVANLNEVGISTTDVWYICSINQEQLVFLLLTW